ncbi:outer membrane protein transport protein [Vibrio tubiashii]|uniref:Aromatic hydrocarbon degradation protein n=1 Tax=Vibrio tubiashii ATCC 19109 TaxID=1051646 RepID=F9TD08_9VIBR|nr:outer membrane protein transport protein [Vibrio tubiashii]AIW13524.1 aromatic hydrocarbon degradation protein [Vibrio tubiashii ATCC 19109]EGU47320.1 long-chain fatty acid transport protein [Vibrio tubiashii ATCC 19109]EIF04190.1 long-chain fatty acid transport protein [Vibrio tubiashii NCIMB 1337 = ATCC 19106]
MNKTRLFKKSLLAVTIATTTLASQQALAAGFQLNSQSATGLGRAFAGDAVIADNASVMSRNAAAMSLFDRTEISVGFNVIDSKVEIKDATYTSPLPGSTPTSLDNTTNDATSVVPNLYIVHPVNEQFAVGLGIYSNFGTTNEFDSNWGKGTGTVITGGAEPVVVPGADGFGGVTNVTTTNIALLGSYRINEQWSVGGGLDIIYGEGELKRQSEMNVLAGTTPTGTTSTQQLMDIDASGWAVGFNLGTVFELDENNRFGLSYHYSPEKEVSGTVTYNTQSNIGDLKIPLPDMFEFSGYHRIEDTKFAVHYSVQWIGWSAFDRLATTNGTEIKEYKWKDTFHYSIGGTYYVNENWEARVGYMFDEGVQDELTSVSVPDSDRQWFSAGATYHINKDQALDLGFTYLVGKDKQVNDTISTVKLDTTTKATAMLFGVQYTHKF